MTQHMWSSQRSVSHRASAESGAGEKLWKDCVAYLDVTQASQHSSIQKSL